MGDGRRRGEIGGVPLSLPPNPHSWLKQPRTGKEIIGFIFVVRTMFETDDNNLYITRYDIGATRRQKLRDKISGALHASAKNSATNYNIETSPHAPIAEDG